MSTKAQLLKGIKLQCQECMGSTVARKEEIDQVAGNLVVGCTVTDCSLFPYRLGKDPWPARKGRTDSFKRGNPARPVGQETS